MAHTFNPPRGPDRRKLPRGGRRAGDAAGFAPLVLLVGSGESVIAQSEAVLAKLRFAVATSSTVEEALRVMTGIRPDVIVADHEAASRIRLEAPEHLPVVEMTDEMRNDPERFLEGIRHSLRANITRFSRG
jgi:CheY-like chemotaxis protein